ncbi:hypothetical protein EVAR_35996_1 [Eumeta japonica]|uniref:Uncharacterized protein n=1 Tax=Eumeta variegata TaxID=151549 RepID=A0A4C1WW83_EUMVA|nr:hypothetical protein EVAR_35996_1 [Eumeta japonica]
MLVLTVLSFRRTASPREIVIERGPVVQQELIPSLSPELPLRRNLCKYDVIPPCPVRTCTYVGVNLLLLIGAKLEGTV